MQHPCYGCNCRRSSPGEGLGPAKTCRALALALEPSLCLRGWLQIWPTAECGSSTSLHWPQCFLDFIKLQLSGTWDLPPSIIVTPTFEARIHFPIALFIGVPGRINLVLFGDSERLHSTIKFTSQPHPQTPQAPHLAPWLARQWGSAGAWGDPAAAVSWPSGSPALRLPAGLLCASHSPVRKETVCNGVPVSLRHKPLCFHKPKGPEGLLRNMPGRAQKEECVMTT